MFDVFYSKPFVGMPAHAQPVDSIDDAAALTKTRFFWVVSKSLDLTTWDWSWEPVPWQSLQRHIWPTKGFQDGGLWLVPRAGFADTNYHCDVILSRRDPYWEVPENIDVNSFDFSWCPSQHELPFIFQFGTQWQKTGGPIYRSPGSTSVKYISDIRARAIECRPKYVIETTLADLVDAHPDEIFWALSRDMSYDDFDFSWHPDSSQTHYLHVFGANGRNIGHTHLVNANEYHGGSSELNFVMDVSAKSADLDIFFVDKHNPMASERFEKLKERIPRIQKTRFVGDWVSTIRRLADKSSSGLFWVISSELDYSEFDFTWFPDQWQYRMLHVFPTKWQRWSDTFLVNRDEFTTFSKWCKPINEYHLLNFESSQTVGTFPIATRILVDFGNAHNITEYDITVDYRDSYFKSIAAAIQRVDSEFVWIIGSVCDYTSFNFSWHPEIWQNDMVHVFPSGDQKFGDTFYVPSSLLEEIVKNDSVHNVNFCGDQTVSRLPMPVVKHDGGSVVEITKALSATDPLTLITDRNAVPETLPVVSLWHMSETAITQLSKSGASLIIPASATARIETQIYDYGVIDTEFSATIADTPLDIVFISNGEPNAEENWESLVDRTVGLKNRIHRVDGIDGRVAAYQAAAQRSQTPWFFAVFAKLDVSVSFDWGWQPDCFQENKHYIFYAKNPVNGLEYGHQAIIAYHKDLVMENTGAGLDFTLDQPHAVVPMLSGTAKFNTDCWSTWRTAFREVIKLKAATEEDRTDADSAFRLNTWLTVGKGKHGKWSTKGAKDAVEYYESVNGDAAALKLSYEWKWLREYFASLNETIECGR